jgi:tetratricopeptide (TPR) repeat protein
VRLEGDGFAPIEATSSVSFPMTAQDREDLRWYLEEYAEFPYDPAPAIAARVERRIAELGVALFEAVFRSSDDARDLWATLRPQLDETRVEVAADVAASGLPWELLRDPTTTVPLALRARAFVRTLATPAQRPQIPGVAEGSVRILLVISRPGGVDDVAFRSVASRLIGALGTDPDRYRLDVLRPATFAQLSRVLREAHLRGEPYHVVHFDGHGAYLSGAGPVGGTAPLVFGAPRPGSHGYLAFERPTASNGIELVDGPTLGALLAETRVPLLVLNACRSAHAEPLQEPQAVDDGGPATDPHAQVRAFGSLAQEVMDAGVASVVAMRYNVYVVTAAQFVADLYRSLLQGQAVGEAVTLGRKQLDADRGREVAGEWVELQDWPVPVVYEAAPLRLFPEAGGAVPRVTLGSAHAMPARGALDQRLPSAPDAGFFGRDETLLALDRHFDTQSVVLLRAYAGSGKTATAAEFGRWYALTGGVDGPVLFTSFERPRPLARVLDDLEPFFGRGLEQQGVHWLTLSDAERRKVALQLLRQVPVLWIWDNVEEVAGFPTPERASLSVEEQQELADFLRAARETKAKFLLTSRRDERGWLGDLPARVTLPAMPQPERIQLTRAIAGKHGRQIADVRAWLPLLRYTQGNPLALTVVVGQALRAGLQTAEQVEAFVARLRAGEADLDDDEEQERSRSLAASLNYGLAHAFTDDERKILSLLSFFQGAVDTKALSIMGSPQSPSPLREIEGKAPDTIDGVLSKAVDIGLLERIGDSHYAIHPALPWFFQRLSSDSLSQVSEGMQATPRDAETAAFVTAMASLGNLQRRRYDEGDLDVINWLSHEETNLLNAQEISRRNGWWPPSIGPLQGLNTLYEHTGRHGEWNHLIDQILPDYIDVATDDPLPGREDKWLILNGYRVDLAVENGDWHTAERLSLMAVNWSRRNASQILTKPTEHLSEAEQAVLMNVVSSFDQLGRVLTNQGKVEAISAYSEAFELASRIGNDLLAAMAAYSSGTCYLTIPDARNLDEAETWYRRSLGLHPEGHLLGRAKVVGQLGAIELARLDEGFSTEARQEELDNHLRMAEQYYLEVLRLIPGNAVRDIAVTHGQLGIVYRKAGQGERSIYHLREALRRWSDLEDRLTTAKMQFQIALIYADAGQFFPALDYARSALRSVQSAPDATEAAIDDARRLTSQLENLIASKEP